MERGHKPALLIIVIILMGQIPSGQLLNLGVVNSLTGVLGASDSLKNLPLSKLTNGDLTSSLPLSKLSNNGLLSGATKALGLEDVKSPSELVPSVADLAKIDAPLLDILKESPNALPKLLVKYGGTQEAIDEIEAKTFSSIAEKRLALVKALQRHAEKKQSSGKSLLSLLNVKDKNKNFQSFWIANNMIVSGADLNIVKTLSTLTEVTGLSIAPKIKLEPLPSRLTKQRNLMNSEREIQWGIEKIHAKEVWDAGVRGEGVTVATIDSGVRGTHEALRNNKRKENAWFDPYDGSSSPMDENGHGTHTMGTICGANGIGVAPGAQWIACRGCSSSACETEALMACGQWMLAPTKPDGTGGNPNLAPHIVSNSWGSPLGGNTWYNEVVNAWNVGGILSVFANGNAGPFCHTSGSPGDQPNVFSVGATDSKDQLAGFSSKGPGGSLIKGHTKPDISAPGKDIYSAWNTGDSKYNTISGTSMATPHVAGVLALMVDGQSRVQDKSSILKMTDFSSAIKSSADQEGLKKDLLGVPCGLSGIGGKKFPNNNYGSGRINALNSVFTRVKVAKEEAGN